MAPRTRSSTALSPSLETALPVELLTSLCTFLPKASLSALALCSRTLNSIATPHLYAHVSFREGFNGSDEPAWEFLLPFAWLIFTSARHAGYVRDLGAQVGCEDVPVGTEKYKGKLKKSWLGDDVNTGDGGDEKEKKKTKKEERKKVENVLREVCARTTVDEADAIELFELVKTGEKESAIFVLMLAHLPNLRTLDYCFDSIGGDERLLRALDLITRSFRQPKDAQKQLHQSSAAFSKPLDIMFTGNDDKYPNDCVHVAAFLSLPNIRALYAWKVGDHDWMDDNPRDDAFFKLQPRSCNVEYMELRDSKLHHEHFDCLMKALVPGKLKTFIYEVGCTWAWVNVHHRKIMDSLSPHYETLECLELSHEDFYPYQFDNDAEEPYPVSFKSFKSLKKLKVAPVYIWGDKVLQKEDPELGIGQCHMLRNALPPTLEELWITRMDTPDRNTEYIPKIVIPALHLVLEHLEESFPHLTSIYCTFFRKKQSFEWLEDLQSFSVVARNHGVEVYIKLMNECMDWEAERRWGWYESVEWAACLHNPGNNCPLVEVAEEDDLRGTLKAYGVTVDGEEKG